MILSGVRSTTSRNASATLAFHQYRKAQEEDGDEATERASLVNISIEDLDNRFRARLRVDAVQQLSILGPKRNSRPEAICDGIELGKAYIGAGSEGAEKAGRRLLVRRWSLKDIEEADEEEMEKIGRNSSSSLGPQASAAVHKLIPPGEGWTRFDDEKLVNQRSQVYFAQVGQWAGHYFKREEKNQQFEQIGVPHSPKELPLTLTAASASSVRKGVKLDRAVILNDITKIARLALKFPLSFVDTPACAYALFQGLRTAEAAQWCAENFHKKLLPLLAEKIHTYEDGELRDILERTLGQLDAELLLSSHAFSGCGALLALVLGNRLIVAAVGRARAALLPERGPARPVLDLCRGDPEHAEEFERIREARGVVQEGHLYNSCETTDEAARILATRHVFEVLQVEADGPTDAKQIKSTYRRLALRVHPDKLPEGADPQAYKMAFARLDSAKDALEAMLAEDRQACKELHKVLRSEVRTRSGATSLLGTEDADEGEKTSKEIWKRLGKMRGVAPDFERAESICREAVATLRRGFTAEALPRHEALIKEGLSTSRAMGVRDLREPYPIVLMKPTSASRNLPLGRCRVALLCGATASISDEDLASSTSKLTRHAKASALRWCQDADARAPCSSAVCIFAEAAQDEPASKRQKVASGGPEGTVRVRHILFSHQQLRQPDPMARRQGVAKTVQEAEIAALAALEKLQQAERDPNIFLRMCRELSDCQSAAQPGTLAGDMGWLGRGQQEAAIEDAVFSIGPRCYSDIITTSRGVHIVQRLA